MKTYIEVANSLATEIAHAEQHLGRLRIAHQSMQALLGNNDGPVVRSLGYTENKNEVVDVSAVRVAPSVPAASESQSKSPSKSKKLSKLSPVSAVVQKKTSQALKAASPPVSTKSNLVPKAATVSKPVSGAKAAAKTKPVKESAFGLPVTGGDFWKKCMGQTKLTSSEIVDRAVKLLGVAPAARPRLMNRFSVWASVSKENKTISAAGARAGVTLYQLTSPAAKVKKA